MESEGGRGMKRGTDSSIDKDALCVGREQTQGT